MQRTIKCPSCGTQMNVGAAQGGSIVGCPGCQVKVRIPTGQTSARLPAVPQGAGVQAPSPAPRRPSPGPARPVRSRRGLRRGRGSITGRNPAVAARRRGAVRRRPGAEEIEEDEEGFAPPEKKSKTGLIIGISIGVVALVGIIVAVAVSGGDEPQQARRGKRGHRKKPTAPAVLPANTGNPMGDTPVQPGVNPFGGTNAGGDTPKPKPAAKPAKKVWNKGTWETTIDGLKQYSSQGYGSGFYEFVHPNARNAWARLQGLNKADAYPYLIAYIADPDPQRARGAIVALKMLCGDPRKGKNPSEFKPGAAASFQAEWKQILGVSDAAVSAAAAELGIGGN